MKAYESIYFINPDEQPKVHTKVYDDGCYPATVVINTDKSFIDHPCVTFHMTEQQLVNFVNSAISSLNLLRRRGKI